MMTRRQLLWSGAGIAAAAAAYPVLVEPRWFEVTHTKVPSPSKERATVRVLHLSDFHASWAVPLSSINYAIKTGIAERPDLICLTGDFITHRYDFDGQAYTASLRRLAAVAPTFAVLGNHDGGVWAKDRRGYSDHLLVDRLLADAGIELLHNRSLEVKVRDHSLRLVGVGDLWSREADGERAFRNVPPSQTRVILLSHNPDSKETLAPFSWDLMLSGHTHGGQVMIPFEGPRYAPVDDLRFVSGLHGWKGRQIYVSRGVGNLGSVRFMCRPEITVLDVGIA